MDLTKLGRNERALAIVGLLAFIDSFLPWYSWSFGPISGSWDGWNSGFDAWFPLLLLLAVGVLVALPAFGRPVVVRGGYAAFTAAALLATVLVLIRWLTFNSDSIDGASVGPDFGTYVGLILAIAGTAFGYLGFTAAGGTLNNFADAFKAHPGQQPPQ